MTEAKREITASENLRWAVIGASGFVGSGICTALELARVHVVRHVVAPRLNCSPDASATEILQSARTSAQVLRAERQLADALQDIDIVVNAAGLARPDASASHSLTGANALLPAVVANAASTAGVKRMIHLSSAAVQGRRQVLDESSETYPFSPYSESKALGEKVLRAWATRAHGPQLLEGVAGTRVVIIRATSVQGAGRSTSNSLARIAASPVSSVAAPGSQPSVVSSLAGLSTFVVSVGRHPENLPMILLQPWEGASVSDVLRLAGSGREPMRLPRGLARTGILALYTLSKILPTMSGLSRRVELMWFGQNQVVGWGASHGLGSCGDLRGAEAVESVAEFSHIRPINLLRQALGEEQ